MSDRPYTLPAPPKKQTNNVNLVKVLFFSNKGGWYFLPAVLFSQKVQKMVTFAGILCTYTMYIIYMHIHFEYAYNIHQYIDTYIDSDLKRDRKVFVGDLPS